MRPHHALLFALVFPALAGTAQPAHAAPPPAFVLTDQKASDRADELSSRGLALGNKDRYAEAEPLLREAWGLKRSYDIAANLGIVEANLGKWRDAAEHLKLALKTFPANGKPEHKKLVETTLSAAIAQVSALTIEATPERAEVFVDGKSAGTAPLGEVVFVDPGPHVVTATLPGYAPAQVRVDAVAGTTPEVKLTLTSLDGPPSPPRLPPPKRSVVPGAVLAGVGGAALIAGTGLFAGGRSKQSSISALSQSISGAGQFCVAGAPSQDPRCGDLHSQATTASALEAAGVGLMIGGGAAAVGSLIYFLVPPSSNAAKSGALRLTPALSPSSGGLNLSGSF